MGTFMSGSVHTELSDYHEKKTATSLSDEEAGYLSDGTRQLFRSINELERSTGTILGESAKGETSLEEVLFDARANVKVMLSQVSMHFEKQLREQVFRQIDILHDIDGWEIEDAPIQLNSLTTFLRWYYITKPKAFPSFGMSGAGQLVASWLKNHNKDRLILEFLSNDKMKWFVTKRFDNDSDHSAGVTSISRSAAVLSLFDTSEWFS